MTLLWLLVLLIGIAVIAHLRVSPVPALAIVAAYLVLMGAADETPTWLMVILWLMLIAIGESARGGDADARRRRDL